MDRFIPVRKNKEGEPDEWLFEPEEAGEEGCAGCHLYKWMNRFVPICSHNLLITALTLFLSAGERTQDLLLWPTLLTSNLMEVGEEKTNNRVTNTFQPLLSKIKEEKQ